MSSENDSLRLPPGIAEAIELRADDETLHDFLRLREQYGNVVSLKSPKGRPVYFVNEPNAIRRILVRDHAKYKKGPGFERVKLLLGNGIFVSDAGGEVPVSDDGYFGGATGAARAPWLSPASPGGNSGT